MTLNEILQLILGSSGLLGIAFLIFRTGRIVEKIDGLDKSVTGLEASIQELRHDVSDIKERVSFIESFVFFSEFKAESNNPRSIAAKKMWERRKMKKVGSKS